jgi:hypothetical protein
MIIEPLAGTCMFSPQMSKNIPKSSAAATVLPMAEQGR